MDYDFEIKKLNNKFYSDYSEKKYPEILQKKTRSYNCLIFEDKYDYFVCIPFRTYMKHDNGYHFKKSVRSNTHPSGLDYSKMVIVKNVIYFDSINATVDNDEYTEMVENIEIISKEAYKYLEDYINHKNNSLRLHKREFERLYNFSTLQYFEDIIL